MRTTKWEKISRWRDVSSSVGVHDVNRARRRFCLLTTALCFARRKCKSIVMQLPTQNKERNCIRFFSRQNASTEQASSCLQNWGVWFIELATRRSWQNNFFVVSFRLVKSLQTLKQNIFRPGRSNRIFLVSRLQLRHGSLRSRKCPPASESTWRQTHRRDPQRRWNHSSQRSASVYTRRAVSFSVDLSRVNVQCPQNKLTHCRTTKLWRTITSRLFASHYRKKCSQILIDLVIKIPAIFIASALVVRCLISSQVHVFPLTQTAADKRLAIISACKLF